MKKGRKRKRPTIRLDGDPILKTVCKPVDEYSNKHASMVCEMLSILHQSKTGVGLAANQAGYDSRIIFVKDGDGWQVMINPSFKTEYTTQTKAFEECLSYPGKSREISRYDYILVSYITPDGKMIIDELRAGLDARIIQHEIDHLNGCCLVGI